MRYQILQILSILLATHVCLAQIPGYDLQRELRTKRIEEVRQSVSVLAEKYKGTVAALYLQAVVADDAKAAAELYQQITIRFPTSPYAMEAQYRIALYHFSRGLYVSAQQGFEKVMAAAPGSEWAVRSQYFAAASQCAAQPSVDCSAGLRRFLETSPGSELAEMARLDLQEYNAEAVKKTAVPKTPAQSGSGRFALQVGAFSSPNHALNLRNALNKEGHDAEIKETTIGGKPAFLVLVGDFASETAATEYGEEIKRRHGRPYRVVSK